MRDGSATGDLALLRDIRKTIVKPSLSFSLLGAFGMP